VKLWHSAARYMQFSMFYVATGFALGLKRRELRIVNGLLVGLVEIDILLSIVKIQTVTMPSMLRRGNFVR